MNTFRLFALGGTMVGALALAGCATVEETAAEATATTYHATLTGAQEVGGGDPDGAGRAEITIADDFDQVCWNISDVHGIGTPVAAHIHYAARGANGPAVFPLKKSNEGTWTGCADGSEWTQNRIEGNPAMFYVNVHTAEYPDGAIRGQLGD
jgi:hypothetical protein